MAGSVRLVPRSLLLCVLLLVSAGIASAQPAFLVKDINTSTSLTFSPFQGGMTAVDGLVYFPLDDGIHGTELWRSDGTEAGTFLVTDICPGVCAAEPSLLTSFGGALYFRTGGFYSLKELWKTDGTAAGTVKVLGPVGLREMAQVNGKLILSMYPQGADDELWVSDGTAEGTVELMDIWPGEFNSSSPTFLGQAGANLYFKANDPDHGRELWKTDGTAAGTALVKDLVPGSGSSFDDPLPASPQVTFAPVNGRLFFAAAGAGGVNQPGLWVTDGTEAGTYRINDLIPGSSWSDPQGMVEHNGDLFFDVHAAGDTWELWKSDGTAAGTLRLKSGVAVPAFLRTVLMGALGGDVFFAGIDAQGSEPWKTDGTPAGTARLADLAPGPNDSLNRFSYNFFTPLGPALLFFANDWVNGLELWKSDGTAAGTSLLAELSPGSGSSSRHLASAGVVTDGRWFFDAADATGWTLWVSDGTAAGTQLVRRFPTQRSSVELPPVMAPLAGSQLFFWDRPLGGISTLGLWKSNGTGAGTVEVFSAGGPAFQPMLPLNDLVVFTANSELWRSDGTAPGTWKIPGSPNYPGGAVQAGGRVFFTSFATGSNLGLWMTDGTSASEVVTEAFGWRDLAAFGDRVLFASQEDSRIWISDGTPAGTSALENAPAYSNTRHITPAGDRFFFTASISPSGTELWVQEGTASPAHQVKDIRPGSNSSILNSTAQLAALGRNVIFSADDGATGEELWGSDGTVAGTVRLADIRPGLLSSSITGLIPGRTKVWFTADDGVHGREPWVTDGTPAGTHMLRDIVPGAGSSHPQELRVVGHLLLFSALDDAHGLELWRSDGTEAGTRLLQDIAPGPEPSSPQGITVADSLVYFTANDNTTGFEPWALPRAALGSFLTATKTVSGVGAEGATVTYTITIENIGAGPSTDNPGGEMVDVLPSGLTLLDASADVGALTVDLPMSSVVWNGALPAGGTAVVTVHAQVNSGAFPGVLVNQASLAFDADGNGTNESNGLSNGPGPGLPTPLPIASGPLDFYTLPPCRLLDTRDSSPLATGSPRNITASGACGIPPTARSVAANVTVTGPTGPGHVMLYPAGTSSFGTSTLNFSASQTRANSATLALKNGALDAEAVVSGNGSVEMVIDVSGYFQ